MSKLFLPGAATRSRLLSDAQWNERATAVNMDGVYALLQRAHATLNQVTAITEKENTPTLLPSRFLMARATPRGSRRCAWG